ncbi:selenocysteine synthase [Luteitalea pratensis]|uniref:Selenocysteine synthase n=1 Tax=Luteitalea pratensis TaxID=1855912 RepID=A0A143PJS0_LUTPR|nr:aminotransferase class V-fold PLP-dependent enzyme [Luteitalea pratensis]AMY08815.1 selenocysteine synthase [Luteitalea pratensis]
MLTRRTFFERLSTLPLVGGFLGGVAHSAEAAVPVARDYFKELGVRPFINAAGTYTDMTASLMPPEVMTAINYASKQFVPLNELHDRIGERIATLVKAEAAMVSSGAAAAMTLGTAGVLTGGDPKKIVDLPNLAGMKTEVIMQKSHRFGYDHAIRNCGVKIVEVETAAELEAAITPQTAMMLFYNNNNSVGQIRDEEFVRLGKKHGVVTMNDCAADVPPVENLWKFTAMGFDLVVFSGGKGIRGPQSAGLLLGRKDLIAAARANAAPNGNSIGRGMKVNKEEMLGMLAAVERFVKLDHEALDREYTRRANVILKSLTGLKGVTASITVPEVANHVPHVQVVLDTAVTGITGQEISKKLREGTPSIGVRPGDELLIGVWMMKPGEDAIVARRLKDVLTKKA